MKKIILIILLSIIIIGIVIGVFVINENIRFSKENTNNESLKGKIEEGTEILKFSERLFLAQLDDVYMNMEEYEGRIIEYTGFVHNIPKTNDFVVAREYYCCGDDASLVGFEAVTDEKFKDETWVKVIGKIVLSNKYEYVTPVLEVLSIEETVQGERYVNY